MGGSQAANTILQIQLAALKNKGEVITDDQKNEILDGIKAKYEETTTPYYAASRLWVDAVIDPSETRKFISIGIAAANHAPITEEYRLGVLQT
jgi:acetyl-CoA carboxylase carboxyltransferase component